MDVGLIRRAIVVGVIGLVGLALPGAPAAAAGSGLSPLVRERVAAIERAQAADDEARRSLELAHAELALATLRLGEAEAATTRARDRETLAHERRRRAAREETVARGAAQRANRDLAQAARVWDRRFEESERRHSQLRRTAVGTYTWNDSGARGRLAVAAAVRRSDGAGEALHRVAQLRRVTAAHGGLARRSDVAESEQRMQLAQTSDRLAARLQHQHRAQRRHAQARTGADRAMRTLRAAEQDERRRRAASDRADQLVREREGALAQAEMDVEAAVAALSGSGWLAGVPSSSGMVWPVDGAPGSGFGLRLHPILAEVRPHRGVDVAGYAGQPVVAADAGRVSAAGARGGYGNAVVIDHGAGRRTLYAHLSRVSVRAGQYVAEAQEVGAVGSTGVSTGPHLHFEVHLDGQPVDPLAFYAAPGAR